MDLDLIRKAAIFAELTDGEAEKVAEVCQKQEFKFGQNIFKEGD